MSIVDCNCCSHLELRLSSVRHCGLRLDVFDCGIEIELAAVFAIAIAAVVTVKSVADFAE